MNLYHDDTHNRMLVIINGLVLVALVGLLVQVIEIKAVLERQTELMQQEIQAPDPADEKPATAPAEPQHTRPMIMMVRAKVTAYTASRSETDSDPGRTAIMERPVPGWTCAVSRDLAHWLGGRVWIEGVGVRRVNDLMHGRFRQRVDVLVGQVKEAASVSADERKVVFLGKG